MLAVLEKSPLMPYVRLREVWLLGWLLRLFLTIKIWFVCGDTVTVSHLTICNTNSQVHVMSCYCPGCCYLGFEQVLLLQII